MNQLFHVGEIAIVVSCEPMPIYRGTECMVTGGLRRRRAAHPFMPSMYINPQIFLITPDGLRKKPPPLGSWAALRSIWQPKPIRERA